MTRTVEVRARWSEAIRNTFLSKAAKGKGKEKGKGKNKTWEKAPSLTTDDIERSPEQTDYDQLGQYTHNLQPMSKLAANFPSVWKKLHDKWVSSVAYSEDTLPKYPKKVFENDERPDHRHQTEAPVDIDWHSQEYLY